MTNSKKNVLVTGAAGQLGQSIKDFASSFFDMKFFYTDIADLDITSEGAIDSYVLNNKIHFIVNCAAYTAVDNAETEPELAQTINADAVANLASAARKHHAALIHISTDYVFGGKSSAGLPFVETDPTNPESVYAETKLAGEEAAQQTENHIIIRTSWLYSKYGNNFLKTMLKLGAERPTIDVVFDQIGTPTYAPDLAFAILSIIRAEQPQLHNAGIYHFSNEGVCSWYDFAVEIMTASKLKCYVYPIDSKGYQTPAKRPYFSVLNKQKIKNTYKISIPHWRVSMLKCIETLG